MRSLLKWFYVVLSALAILGFVGGWGLHWRYGVSSPTSPDALSGRIYPVSYHGAFVYLTKSEHMRLKGLFVMSIAGLAGAFCLQAVADPFGWSKKQRL